MRHTYEVTAQLWDTTDGEALGELLHEAEPAEVVRLSSLEDTSHPIFLGVRAATGVPLDGMKPILARTMSVAMTRQSGACMVRRRFQFNGRRYLVALRVRRAALVNVLLLLAKRAAPGFEASLEFRPEHTKVLFKGVNRAAMAEESRGLHPVTGRACIATRKASGDDEAVYVLTEI